MGEESNFGSKLAAMGILFVVVALVLGIGSEITGTMEGKYVNTTLTSNAVVNESWASASNATTNALTNVDRVDGTSMVVTNSSSAVLDASAYTVVTTNPATIVLTNGSFVYNGTNLNMSYSYDTVARTIAEESFSNGTAGIGELSSWLPTIALVLAASLIIGVITLFFRRRM